MHDIFRRQRLKVELVRDGEVSGNSLWIVVDDDCFIAFFMQRLNAVDGCIVKLYPCPIRIGPEPRTMIFLRSEPIDSFSFS
jgi:hypothetical protein